MLKKIYLSREASKDAKRGFGDALEIWYDTNNDPKLTAGPVPVSNTMAEMVGQYHRDCAYEMLKLRTKGISQLFEEIQMKVKALDSIENEINSTTNTNNNEITAIESEITQHISKINTYENYLHVSRETGSLPVQSGFISVTDLKMGIETLSNEKETLLRKSVMLRNENKKTMADANVNISKIKASLREQVALLMKQIEIAMGKINFIEKKYDHWQRYYWKKLCRKMEVDVNQISFEEMCKLCNTPIINKESLFDKELLFIKNNVERHINTSA